MPAAYLDNSATTRPDPAVAELMNKIQRYDFGNPSSQHSRGLAAEKLLKTARRQLAIFFRRRSEELIFTSGGTEANNLAIKGIAFRYRRRGNHLITSVTEHPSVLDCYAWLADQGFRVSYLPVEKSGLIDPDRLAALIDKETLLVSLAHINNEIGTVQPLSLIGPLIKARNAQTIFHVDAVQSLTRLPLEVDRWQADLVSCSAHKIHGPKGAGSLWLREGLDLEPQLHGGGQESGWRSGTENVAAIAGFGLAASLCANRQPAIAEKLTTFKKGFYEVLAAEGIHFQINGPDLASSAPHILNLSFPGLKAELILHSLAEKGIFVSAGSACHSRHRQISHVLEALQLNPAAAESALRFSFSTDNDWIEVVAAAKQVASTINELQILLN